MMGLDCSHGAFNGGYSAFNRLRQYVAATIGGSYPPHEDRETFPNRGMWYWEPDDLPQKHLHGLEVFLNHSDCDGVIAVEDLTHVAGALEWVADHGEAKPVTGHLAGYGDMAGAVRTFATGCCLAYQAGEPLEFG